MSSTRESLRPARRFAAAMLAAALLLGACDGAGEDGDRTNANAAGVGAGVGEAGAAGEPGSQQPSLLATPHVDPDARNAGVPAGKIYLDSEAPGALAPEDIQILERVRAAAFSEEDLGSGYSLTREEYRPNYRMLEEATRPGRTKKALLASARVDGYATDFDERAGAGIEQVTSFFDLFVNPTGASVAVKRAADLVNATSVTRLRDAPKLQEQAAVMRLGFSRGMAYAVWFRRGRLVGGVQVTYMKDPGSPAQAIRLATRLAEKLNDEGI